MMKRRGHGRGQRFVTADYYELDWYYDECTDGKAALRSGRGKQPIRASMEKLAGCNCFPRVKRTTSARIFFFLPRLLLLSNIQVQSTSGGK